MHDNLKPFKKKKKTNPKILWKTYQFWKNPKNFRKPQKLGQKIWNAW